MRVRGTDARGGTVYDIGIYCLNAALYLFRSEPEAVAAFSARGDDPRFRNCDETTTVMLRFPGEQDLVHETAP